MRRPTDEEIEFIRGHARGAGAVEGPDDGDRAIDGAASAGSSADGDFPDPDTPAGRDYRAAFEALRGTGGVSFSAVARNAGPKGRSPVPLISRPGRFPRLRREIQAEIDRQDEARRQAAEKAQLLQAEREAARDPEEARYEGKVRALSSRLRASDSLNMRYEARSIRATRRSETARRRYERIRAELSASGSPDVPPAFDDLPVDESGAGGDGEGA